MTQGDSYAQAQTLSKCRTHITGTVTSFVGNEQDRGIERESESP